MIVMLALWPADAGGKGIFYSEEGSRKELYPAATGVVADTLKIDSATAAAVKDLTRQPIGEKLAVFERVLSQQATIGYVYRARERGKVELMDFAVALDTD
ncbi:MAG: hypothetical protein ABI036_15005, partial [Fibrobacteria bacterium]